MKQKLPPIPEKIVQTFANEKTVSLITWGLTDFTWSPDGIAFSVLTTRFDGIVSIVYRPEVQALSVHFATEQNGKLKTVEFDNQVPFNRLVSYINGYINKPLPFRTHDIADGFLKNFSINNQLN